MSDHAELYARSLKVAPGGVHSPVRAFHSVGGLPIFIRARVGSEVVRCHRPRLHRLLPELRPVAARPRDADVRAASADALKDGWSYGCCEPYSLDLAEWITTRVPWAEKIRFVSSGTEAVMSALRVARAATGRPRILKFDGCYHGHADSMLVSAGSGLAGQAVASSDGVSAAVAAETVVAPLDDEDDARSRCSTRTAPRSRRRSSSPCPRTTGCCRNARSGCCISPIAARGPAPC